MIETRESLIVALRAAHGQTKYYEKQIEKYTAWRDEWAGYTRRLEQMIDHSRPERDAG